MEKEEQDPQIVYQRAAFCKQLADIAKEKNISQGDLAAGTGLKQETISRMFAGKFAPRLDNILAVCQVLGVTLELSFKLEKLEM
jgi:transcriptional regulator with XRE-family HTH domain